MWPSGPQENPTKPSESSHHLEQHTSSSQEYHNNNNFQSFAESLSRNNPTNSAEANQAYSRQNSDYNNPNLSQHHLASSSTEYPNRHQLSQVEDSILPISLQDHQDRYYTSKNKDSAYISHTPSDRDTTPPLQSPPNSGFSAITSDPSNSSIDSFTLIARVSIPKSHHTQFVQVLSSPPDPSLKIKKSVRFISPSLDTAAQSTSSRRRERSSSGEPISPSPSLSNNNYISSNKLYQLSITDKDPEEKMAELMELKQMKIRQEDFLHVKDQIYQITHTLEEKQSVLDEVKSERKSLQSELSRYIIMVKQIQKDYELIQQAEAELTKDRDQLSQQLTQLRDHDFNFLKEEVDQLRAKKGLRPLPSLEQEEAEHLGRYLEKRREHWRGDGSQDLAGPSDNTSSRGAPSSSSSSAPIHSHRASGSSSGTRPLRNSASASSIGSSSSNAATSSGRDRGRPGKSHHHSSPGHSRSSSSSGKSKYEVSSSRSARQSQSRSQSPSRPSSSSSANLRAERLKKRSRY